MKINKKVKVIILTLLGIFIAFNAFMIWHILDQTKKANAIDNPTDQISRIDFDKPFDSISELEIKKALHSIPGVKKRVTVVRNIVVYRHDNKVTNAKKVYSQLMSKGNYSAKPFNVPAAFAGKEVCPAMKKEGFYYNYTQLVLRIFN
ncbi:MAG TPA: hypothetical protein VF677_16570 [Flavobacterium sp.]|jgi:hypothetical protein